MYNIMFFIISRNLKLYNNNIKAKDLINTVFNSSNRINIVDQ